MADAPHTSLGAEADPSLSETLGAELASSILDIDALTFDSSEFHSSGYVSVSPQDKLEQNDFFNVNFDELWSANLAQIPPGASTTDFNQSQPVGLSHHQESNLPQDVSVSQEGLIQQGRDYSNHEFDDLLNNVFEFPTSNRLSTHTPDAGTPPLPSALPPKIGNRFTLDSLRALKEWFSKHSKNPYPTEEEKTMLERQTGLNRTQVTNWLANARRRRTTTDSGTQTAAARTAKSPSDATYTPRRAGTPIPRSRHSPRNMDPLQRWVDSPPENEPAAASAIARAMASGDIVSSRSRRGSSDERLSRRRRHISSHSSFATSRSASTDSRSSRGSISATSSHSRGRSIQKRRTQKTSLTKPRHVFQCTFCTETFRRKYDWQRHENSLHLPLERWVCSPDGPTATNPEDGQIYCLFCGEVNPSEDHLAAHNPSTCKERVFSRKDHLKQHLRLVHNARLTDLSTKLWKTAQPDITSKCGFCQASLSTWLDRVDHLANHFKMGCAMRDWVGDWGFEDSVLETIEKSMPPYLIEFERHTPFPFSASGKPPDSPRSAYELITLELAYFVQNHNDTAGGLPSHTRLQLEACRIVFASEVTFPEPNSDSDGASSWLRDLLLSSEEITQEARFGPIRSPAESRLSVQRIKGKNALFEGCPLESRLQAFLCDQRAMRGRVVHDQELQKEASRIIMQMENELGTRPDFIANWLIGFLNSSSNWLSDFRQRVDLMLKRGSWKVPTPNQQSHLPSLVGDQTDVQPHSVTQQRVNDLLIASGKGGSVAGHDGSLGTSTSWPSNNPDTNADWSTYAAASLGNFPSLLSTGQSGSSMPQTSSSVSAEKEGTIRPAWLGTGIFVLNDMNHFPWFTRELKRWVKAAMSPNNPICHIPSDEELRHQARCLLYNDDDPWNQTPADNAQWLKMFKRDVGIV